jgi:hypothetical protein
LENKTTCAVISMITDDPFACLETFLFFPRVCKVKLFHLANVREGRGPLTLGSCFPRFSRVLVGEF